MVLVRGRVSASSVRPNGLVSKVTFHSSAPALFFRTFLPILHANNKWQRQVCSRSIVIIQTSFSQIPFTSRLHLLCNKVRVESRGGANAAMFCRIDGCRVHNLESCQTFAPNEATAR